MIITAQIFALPVSGRSFQRFPFPSAVFRRSLGLLASLSDALGQANTLEMNILVSMPARVSEPQS